MFRVDLTQDATSAISSTPSVASPSQSATTSTTSSTPSVSTTRKRARYTQEDLLALVETCLEYAEVYEHTSKKDWYADVAVELRKRTQKDFADPQKKFEQEIRDRKAYKKKFSEGESPSVSTYERHLDEWIEFQDDLEEREKEATKQKQQKKKEADLINATQLRSVRTFGRRQRQRNDDEPSINDIETAEEAVDLGETDDTSGTTDRDTPRIFRERTAESPAIRSARRGRSTPAIDRMADAVVSLVKVQEREMNQSEDTRFKAIEDSMAIQAAALATQAAAAKETNELLRALLQQRTPFHLPIDPSLQDMSPAEAESIENGARSDWDLNS